jgi:hypothetical protein
VAGFTCGDAGAGEETVAEATWGEGEGLLPTVTVVPGAVTATLVPAEAVALETATVVPGAATLT